MNSLYGNFRTRTFCDIFDNADTLYNFFVATPLGDTVTQQDINIIYMLLASKYGNSNIAYSSEDQFKLRLCTLIASHGPVWSKRTEIQKKLRTLTDEEIFKGGKNVYNHAYNPGQAPSTDDATGEPILNYINDQTSQITVRSKMSGYTELLSLLDTDVNEDFLREFRKLFLVIVEYEVPLWYTTDIEGDDTI